MLKSRTSPDSQLITNAFTAVIIIEPISPSYRAASAVILLGKCLVMFVNNVSSSGMQTMRGHHIILNKSLNYMVGLVIHESCQVFVISFVQF